jgi:hypothetical protein
MKPKAWADPSIANEVRKSRRRIPNRMGRKSRAIFSIPRCTPKYTTETVAEATDQPARRREEEKQRPTSDDGVVAEKDEPAEHAPESDDGPGRTDRLLEGAHDALLRLSTDEKLRHHDRETDAGDADEVDENERAPVVFPGDERELPEVPEADRASGGGENEACAGSPVSALLCHAFSVRVTVRSRR